ncbi:hypothetical protein FNH09_29220 [Streptomyces adustus]|uniref:Uncharacterized protein n=1 Tax=Streptomyces adustus TaxID=1609272 RepID=A0A5N8VIY6_9ACTN|nr:hypothetical protein [Streptomyces adustus]
MRHPNDRTAVRRARPRTHPGRTPGTSVPCGPAAAAPRGPGAGGTAPSPGEPPAPAAPPAAETASPDAAADFLRALRAPRPPYGLDETPFSDPLTAAISRFTGIAPPYPSGP